MISVILPVYNEENTVKEIIKQVYDLPLEKEIIIVNDCSTDNTPRILGELHLHNVTIVNHLSNRGKGAAIRTALQYVKGEICVIQDADLELDPLDILKLIEPIVNNDTQVVFGVRNNYKKISFKHFFLSLLIDFALIMFQIELFIFYGFVIKDMMSCYKVLSTELFKSLDLHSDGFEIEAEITSQLLMRKMKPFEININYYPRLYKEGKKIVWKDAVKIFFSLIKFKFSK